MKQMDTLILEKISQEYISVEAMTELLIPLTERQIQSSRTIGKNLAARETEVLSAKRVLDNLYKLVEEGLINPGDPDFKKRFSAAKSNFDTRCVQRDQVAKELLPEAKIDHEKIRDFVGRLSEVFDGDCIPTQKGYLRALIDEIVVEDSQITISCRRSNFENAIKAGSAAAAAVPTFVREWRRLSPQYKPDKYLRYINKKKTIQKNTT